MVSLDAHRVSYSADLTLREARARYFRDNQFGDDGGYSDAWVDFKLGRIPFPFPNTKARIKAVRYHDLHHVITGYRTDFPGEVEIAAWELGAGCKSFFAAWHLNLAGAASGLWFMPRRTFAAFVRGRRSESLYERAFEPLLDLSVAEARDLQHVPQGAEEPLRPTLADWAWFVPTVMLGTVVSLLSFAVFLPLLPLGLFTAALRARSRRAQITGA
jgi:hypothetical protein